MKIGVQRLGAIQRAEIELRPLTIFVGPNNAGKTWLAYMIAGIFGEYGPNAYARFLLDSNRLQDFFPLLDSRLQQFLEEGTTSIDIVHFAEQSATSYFHRVASRAKFWMRDYLSTRRANFKRLSVDMHLTDKEDFLQRVLRYSVDDDFPRGLRLLRVVKNEENPILYFYAQEKISEKLPPQRIKLFFLENVFKVLHSAIYPQVFTFPTERTTFITMLSGAKMAPTPPNEPTKLQPTLPLSTPLGNFLSMIISVFAINPLDREEEAKDNASVETYLSLAHLLELGILNGEMEVASSALDISLEFLYKPNRDVSLEIQVASSMVKELSPFILYLRYLAKPGQLLVIDEPEMNLHPAAQVRLIELIAMLVNAGLNVLFTTHSTYMVDHLTNLIKATNIRDKEAIRRKFFLNSADAFLSRDQVSVYLFDNKEAHSIMDENGTINWSTFSDVSDQVTDIFLELVEREINADS